MQLREANQMGNEVSKADRKAATERWLAAGVRETIGPFCFCSERQYPHPVHLEEKGVFDYHRTLRYTPKRVGRSKAPAKRKTPALGPPDSAASHLSRARAQRTAKKAVRPVRPGRKKRKR